MSGPTETEIKLRWTKSPEEARRLIEQSGFSESRPRVFETNRLFDRGDELRTSDRLLRLRSAGDRWTLTYKGPASRERHKSRVEIETIVDNGPAMAGILGGLGYSPGFSYEKYRTEFSTSGEPGIIVLDETPVGVFMELEGPADWIDRTAHRMGFSPAEYLTQSYATLYREAEAGGG